MVEKKKKKKRQKGKGIPFGLIASLVAPILGEVAKPIFKKYLEDGSNIETLQDGKTNSNSEKKSQPKSS